LYENEISTINGKITEVNHKNDELLKIISQFELQFLYLNDKYKVLNIDESIFNNRIEYLGEKINMSKFFKCIAIELNNKKSLKE